MRLDNIKDIETLWYEDENGNKLDFDIRQGHPNFPKGQKWYQISKNACVVDSVCSESRDAKWPVRALMWVISKMPNSWKKQPSQIFRGETGMNFVYPIVKYLVDNKGWHFSDACVLASDLCERCMNIVLWELEGEDLTKHTQYLKDSGTLCKHCEYIDEDYFQKRRVRCCYFTYEQGGDVAKAYKNVRVYDKDGQCV